MSAAGVVRLSRSATSVVAKAASGFHLLRIDGYSQAKTVLPGEKISSTGFTVGSESWRMDYYPNGRDAAARSNHASVYIQLTDDRTRRPVQARYKFSLLDHAGNTAYELPAETGSFTGIPEPEVDDHYYHPFYSPRPRMRAFRSPAAAGDEEGPGCGHEQFIGREELEHLIRDDFLVVRCDVGLTEMTCSRLAADEIDNWEDDDEGGEAEEGSRIRPRPAAGGSSSTCRSGLAAPTTTTTLSWRDSGSAYSAKTGERCHPTADSRARSAPLLPGTNGDTAASSRLAPCTATWETRIDSESESGAINILLYGICAEPALAQRPVIVAPSDLHRQLLALLRSGRRGDVAFSVGGELFAAHKYMLAARSPVFMAELFGPMQAKNSPVVRVDDMEPSVFEAMLEFIYSDSLPEIDVGETLEMAQHLLVAADRYDLQSLKSICKDMLCGNIDTRTTATALTLAEQHGCGGLKDACILYLSARAPGGRHGERRLSTPDRELPRPPHGHRRPDQVRVSRSQDYRLL
ncbi:BTB/POZ and MATH domain-containing protein 1-like [Aegilops tauschii subsp. strangulata]|uniref:Speckle-type POZ protein n=1 Tax=Aegilops tauschii TaxID=37682 RepID=M8BZM7_AEGTA|nr:BTB/POZ and MATH domain-containing protein 1-like [Triticum aestivum]